MKNRLLLLALCGIVGASAQAQTLTVTDQGLTSPSGFATGNLVLDNRFGFDDTEDFGQTFSLSQGIRLKSIWIAYDAFVDRSGTYSLTVDAGDDGSAEISVVNIALDGVNFSGATTDGNTGPFYWMKWDVSSFNLDLPAGVSSYTIACTGEGPPGAATWVFAPCYSLNNDPYPGGDATGIPGTNPNSDMGFAILGSVEPGTSYCSGDGSGTSCPCGNPAGAGEGCANGTGVGGILAATGSDSIGAGDLVLTGAQLPANQPGLFFQGTNAVNSGNGLIFGDGLRCAGGSIIRLQVSTADGAGNSSTSINVATKGGVVMGDTRRYQLWYRDPAGSPCGALFNLTNGYEITWLP